VIRQLLEQRLAFVVMGAITAVSLGFVASQNLQAFLVGLAALVAVGLLIVAYLLVMRARKRRAEQAADNVIRDAAAADSERDAARSTEIAGLKRKFESGVSKLESVGLSLSALPWVVVIGEPSSGKTEAIRRCKIPFPPDLTDELQGTGGTANMDWWFTNEAVLLDTAGKMLFDDVDAAESTEWVAFLKLIKSVRPRSPINGMLLTIPADSLLTDSTERIDKAARKIARQLAVIQRTLGVRFPVYVTVTKSDLIGGFREFFGGLDERLHQQIMGWSNPDPIDEPFEVEKLEQAVDEIVDRLGAARVDVLADPPELATSADARLDATDMLYEFPAAVDALRPALRRYLETIFSSGKLAPNPLFFRGLYFTSSVQKGSALDSMLADSLNVPLERLREESPFERVRPMFLRDLFVKKVFPEHGLVTSATDVQGLKTKRQLTVLGGVAALLLLFFGFAWFQWAGFNSEIGDARGRWIELRQDLSSAQGLVQLTRSEGAGTAVGLGINADDPKLLELFRESAALAAEELRVPWTMRMASGFRSDLGATSRVQTHRRMLVNYMLRPAVTIAYEALAEEDADDRQLFRSTTDRVRIAEQLLRLRTFAEGDVPAGDGEAAELMVDLGLLLDVALSPRLGSGADGASHAAILASAIGDNETLDPVELFRHAFAGRVLDRGDDEVRPLPEPGATEVAQLAALALRDLPDDAEPERIIELALDADGTLDASQLEPPSGTSVYRDGERMAAGVGAFSGALEAFEEITRRLNALPGSRAPAQEAWPAIAARWNAANDTIQRSSEQLRVLREAILDSRVGLVRTDVAGDLAAAMSEPRRALVDVLRGALPAEDAVSSGWPSRAYEDAVELLDGQDWGGSLSDNPPRSLDPLTSRMRANVLNLNAGLVLAHSSIASAAGAVDAIFELGGDVDRRGVFPSLDDLAELQRAATAAEDAVRALEQLATEEVRDAGDADVEPYVRAVRDAGSKLSALRAAAVDTQTGLVLARVDAAIDSVGVIKDAVAADDAGIELPPLARVPADARFDPKYAPSGARRVASALAALERLFSESEAETSPETAQRVLGRLRAYAESYSAYWRSDALDVVRPDLTGASWSEVRAAIGELDLAETRTAVASWAAHIAEARAVFERGDGEPGAADAPHEIELGALESWQSAWDTDLRGASPQPVRAALRSELAGDTAFAGRLVAGLGGEELRRTLYWPGWIDASLVQLAGALRDLDADTEKRISDSFKKFPLVRDSGGSDTLTRDQLGEAATALATLIGESSAGPDLSLASDWPETTRAALTRIVDPFAGDADRREQYALMRRIAVGLGDRNLSTEVWVADPRRRFPNEGSVFAEDSTADYDQVWFSTREVGDAASPWGARESSARWRNYTSGSAEQGNLWRGRSLARAHEVQIIAVREIRSAFPERWADEPHALATESGRWAVLRLAVEADRTRASAESADGQYEQAARIRFAQGGTANAREDGFIWFWFRLTGTRVDELPDLDQWPSAN
jgi:hypothetical protein